MTEEGLEIKYVIVEYRVHIGDIFVDCIRGYKVVRPEVQDAEGTARRALRDEWSDMGAEIENNKTYFLETVEGEVGVDVLSSNEVTPAVFAALEGVMDTYTA
jgi:hypothetical protein